MRRRRWAALTVVTLLASSALATPAAAAPSPTDPTTWRCGSADLGLGDDTVELAPVLQGDRQPNGAAITRTPDAIGRYVPVILIHGWTGSDTVSTPTDRSGAFSHLIDLSPIAGTSVSVDRSMLGQLQGLPGAAVFTFDYHPYSARWVDDSHLGPAFGQVVDCLYRASGEKVIVVAHSMGGLVARYAATHAGVTASNRAGEISTVVTFGTPETGSLLAAIVGGGLDAAALAGFIAGRAGATFGDVVALLRLLLAQCGQLASKDIETGTICDRLPAFVRAFDSSAGQALRSGSSQLAALAPWPKGITVDALAGGTTLDIPAGWFSLPWDTTAVPVGDMIVMPDSATSGATLTRTAFCAYQLNAVRGATDQVGLWFGLAAQSDVAQFPLGAFSGACFHTSLMRDAQLTAEATGAVADELRAVVEPPYAFLTHSQLEVVAGSRITAQVTADFGSGSAGLSYTRDGRYAFAVSRPWENDATIVAVDTGTGQSRRIRCGCAAAVATTGAMIAWVQSRTRLMAVDLATGAAPHPITATLPRWSGDTSGTGPYALSGNGDGVLIAYADQTSAYGGPQRLFLIDPAGHARDLGDTNSNVAIGLAAAPAGPGRIALVDSAHGGGCQTYQTVALLDPHTGTQTEPPPNPAIGTGVDDGIDGSAVDDLWWGADGKLYATMHSWLCSTRTDEPINVVPPSLWRLDGNHWVSIDAGPLLATRQLNPHVKAVVVGDSWYTGGTLYTEVDGHGTKIATGVVAIAAPAPTPAAPGKVTLPNGPPACQASLLPSPGPGVKITSLTCHQRYAIAHLTGHINVNGTETELYVANGVRWRLVASGATSHGALIGCDIYFAGIDAQRIVDLFSNEDIVGGGAPC